jgi:hypothetical protein
VHHFIQVFTMTFIAHVNSGASTCGRGRVGTRGDLRLGARDHPRAAPARLVRTRNVLIEEIELVDRALDEYAAGKSELADFLILGKARVAAGELLTFDKKLAREEDVVLL